MPNDALHVPDIQICFNSKAMGSVYKPFCDHWLQSLDPMLDELLSYPPILFPLQNLAYIVYSRSADDTPTSDPTISAFYPDDPTSFPDALRRRWSQFPSFLPQAATPLKLYGFVDFSYYQSGPSFPLTTFFTIPPHLHSPYLSSPRRPCSNNWSRTEARHKGNCPNNFSYSP